MVLFSEILLCGVLISIYFGKFQNLKGLTSSELQVLKTASLDYLNQHHFVLVNFKEAGFQSKDGNILISKAAYINDERPKFGRVQTDFGDSGGLQIFSLIKIL